MDYLLRTGGPGYRSTPGNLAAHVLTRDLPDGRTEIVTLNFWTSLEDVRGFAGDDVEGAVCYPRTTSSSSTARPG